MELSHMAGRNVKWCSALENNLAVPKKKLTDLPHGPEILPLGIFPKELKTYFHIWKTVWRFLQKLKIDLPYDPAIPLLGIYPDKTIIPKDTCTLMFIAALLTIARTWKQPKRPSTDEWIKKMCYI